MLLKGDEQKEEEEEEENELLLSYYIPGRGTTRSKRKRDKTRAITVSWGDAGRCIPPDCIVFVSSPFSASHCSGIRSFSLRESPRES